MHTKYTCNYERILYAITKEYYMQLRKKQYGINYKFPINEQLAHGEGGGGGCV